MHLIRLRGTSTQKGLLATLPYISLPIEKTRQVTFKTGKIIYARENELHTTENVHIYLNVHGSFQLLVS